MLCDVCNTYALGHPSKFRRAYKHYWVTHFTKKQKLCRQSNWLNYSKQVYLRLIKFEAKTSKKQNSTNSTSIYIIQR